MAGKFYMTDFEIARDFRLAKDREMMVEVLPGRSVKSVRNRWQRLQACAARKGGLLS